MIIAWTYGAYNQSNLYSNNFCVNYSTIRSEPTSVSHDLSIVFIVPENSLTFVVPENALTFVVEK